MHVCVLRFLKMASQGNWSITYSSVVHEKSSKLCVRAHDYLVTILYHIKLEFCGFFCQKKNNVKSLVKIADKDSNQTC